MSFVAVGIVAGVGTGLGVWQANKAQKKAEKQARKANREQKRLKEVYANLDTSNPYADMENVMEDLTIDQKATDLQRQQFQQSQANILDTTRGAAGGSGIASVAQAMAQQGQLASQQTAAGIGAQERANQAATLGERSRLQGLERQGEVWSRGAERDKQGTLLGMAQQETAAFREQAAQAQQAKMDAISSGVSTMGTMFGA